MRVGVALATVAALRGVVGGSTPRSRPTKPGMTQPLTRTSANQTVRHATRATAPATAAASPTARASSGHPRRVAPTVKRASRAQPPILRATSPSPDAPRTSLPGAYPETAVGAARMYPTSRPTSVRWGRATKLAAARARSAACANPERAPRCRLAEASAMASDSTPCPTIRVAA